MGNRILDDVKLDQVYSGTSPGKEQHSTVHPYLNADWNGRSNQINRHENQKQWSYRGWYLKWQDNVVVKKLILRATEMLYFNINNAIMLRVCMMAKLPVRTDRLHFTQAREQLVYNWERLGNEVFKWDLVCLTQWRKLWLRTITRADPLANLKRVLFQNMAKCLISSAKPPPERETPQRNWRIIATTQKILDVENGWTRES